MIFKVDKRKQIWSFFWALFLGIFISISGNAVDYKHATDLSAKKLIRILVIEGGGIHGILSTRILQALEEKTHKPVSALFDVMVGTSTGSIEIALFNKPKPGTDTPVFTAKEILNFYINDGASILNVSWFRKLWTLNGFLAPLLTHHKMEKIFSKFLDYSLGDTLKPVLIPSYDLNSNSLFLFDSLDPMQKDFNLVDVVIASTSVPNIFPARPYPFSNGQVHYLTDAAFIANNPTLLGLIYVRELYPNQPILVVSLGSGVVPFNSNPKNIGTEGLAYALGNWLRMVFVGDDRKFNEFMGVLKLEHGLGLTEYFRFNPILPESLLNPLNASPEAINQLKEVADQFIEDNNEKLDTVAKLLESSSNN